MASIGIDIPIIDTSIVDEKECTIDKKDCSVFDKCHQCRMSVKKIERGNEWNSNELVDGKELSPITPNPQENLVSNTEIVYADHQYEVSVNGNLIDEVNEESLEFIYDSNENSARINGKQFTAPNPNPAYRQCKYDDKCSLDGNNGSNCFNTEICFNKGCYQIVSNEKVLKQVATNHLSLVKEKGKLVVNGENQTNA